MKHQKYEMSIVLSVRGLSAAQERLERSWSARVCAIVVSRGFRSVSHFVDAHPLCSLEQLGAVLGTKGVGRGRIEAALVAEAHQENTVELRARDLLARTLASMPGGWPGPRPRRTARWERDALEVLACWLPNRLAEVDVATLARVSAALLTRVDLPPGWVPSGGDDPVIVDVFRLHWPKQHSLEWTRRIGAFNRALGVVGAKCAQFNSAIRSGSIDVAEYAARDAHDFWLAARRLLLRLAAQEEIGNPHVAGAKISLASRHRSVIALFEWGKSELAGTRARGTLIELQKSLSAESGESGSGRDV